jgi:hypothetical protein
MLLNVYQQSTDGIGDMKYILLLLLLLGSEPLIDYVIKKFKK